MISQCTRRIMSIASDAPAVHTPSVMRSALLSRKVSITISLRRHATSEAVDRESRSEGLSRDYQEILRVEAAMPRTARSGGVSGMHHRTTVRRAGLIGGTVDSRPYK